MKRLIVLLILISTSLGLPDTVVAQGLKAEWTQKRSTVNYPSGVGSRTWHELAFDSLNGKLMVFGGAGGAGYLNDIWHYDPLIDIWSPIETPVDRCPGHSGFGGPDGRDNQAVEYDPVNHLYWSVGGSGYKCGPLAPRTAQAGSDSTTVIDPTLASDIPDFYKDWTVTANGRKAYVTSYDPATKMLRLASSIMGLTIGTAYTIQVVTSGGTWYYSPVTREWRSFEGPHWGYTGPNPGTGGRGGAAMAYSSKDRVFVLFGGHNGNGLNDTWILDLMTKTWIQKLPSSSTGFPFKRKSILGSMVYDSRNDVFIQFGGLCSDSRCPVPEAPVAETWAYKISTNTWTQMFPSTTPPARYEHRMAYDSGHGVIVLFGGNTVKGVKNESTLLNDLWIYDYLTNTWTEIRPQTSPRRRHLHALEYDPVAGLTVLYGGSTSTVDSNEVWTLRLAALEDPENQPPLAVVSVTPTTGILGTTFNFDGSGSSDGDGSIVSYQWNFGDGTAAEGVNAAHQFTTMGIFTVILTVTDNQGATGRATISVNATPALPDPPQVEITSVRLFGTVSDPAVTQIIVNGASFPVAGGVFEAPVSINSASSTSVVIEATGAGGSTMRTLTIDMP